MPQIMAQTSYFQAQLLLITYNTFIITVSSKCLHHFSSKMANPITLKMYGKTTKSSNTLQHSNPAERWYMDNPSIQKTGNNLIQYWLTVILPVRKFPALCLELNHCFLSEIQGTDKYFMGAECKVSDAKVAGTQSIQIISLTVTNMYMYYS